MIKQTRPGSGWHKNSEGHRRARLYGRERFIEPMLAYPKDDRRLDGKREFYLERKWDGTRVVIVRDERGVRLYPRSWLKVRKSYEEMYPELVREVLKLSALNNNAEFLLDSELIFMNKKGEDVFMTAYATPETKKEFSVHLVIFDILKLNGKSLMGLPLSERKLRLHKLFEPMPSKTALLLPLPISASGISDIRQYFRETVKKKAEGIMLKDPGSIYKPGKRDWGWMKWKKKATDDFIVVGYTESKKGARKGKFRALVLAQYDEPKGLLMHAGNVGTGISFEEVDSLANRLKTFTDPGLASDPREFPEDAGSMPAYNLKKVFGNNVKFLSTHERFVVEVEYMSRSKSGHLRMPVFLRMRPDKRPEECVWLRA